MRWLRILLLFGIAIAVPALHACNQPAPISEDTALEAPVSDGVVAIISDADTTDPVTLKVGQTMAVTLQSNFDWTITGQPETLELIARQGGPTSTAQRDGHATGGASWFVFHLRATAVGEGTLELAEAPGWEPERVQQRARIPVRVEP